MSVPAPTTGAAAASPAALDLTPSGVLAVQRRAGNRATRRVLQRNGARERREKHPVGLATSSNLAEFKTAIDRAFAGVTWRKHKGADKLAEQTVAAVVRTCHAALNDMLRTIPVPTTDLVLQGSRWGAFDARSWTMRIGIDEKGRRPVDQNTLKEYLVTLYHESRHAEQAFLEVRRLLADAPDLTPDELKRRHRVVIAPKAFALAQAMAQQSIGAWTAGHQALLEFLNQPEGMAGDQEALAFIRRSYSGPVTSSELADALASASPREFGTAIANERFDRARERAHQVKQWIRAYNRAEPSDLSAITGDSAGDEAFRQLHSAYQSFAHGALSRPEFLDAYLRFLVRARMAALQDYSTAYVAYSVTNPTESDAHAVETALRAMLGVNVGLGHCDIPDPINWLKPRAAVSAAVGPPPPTHQPPPPPPRANAPALGPPPPAYQPLPPPPPLRLPPPPAMSTVARPMPVVLPPPPVLQPPPGPPQPAAVVARPLPQPPPGGARRLPSAPGQPPGADKRS